MVKKTGCFTIHETACFFIDAIIDFYVLRPLLMFVLGVVLTQRFPLLPPQTWLDELQEVINITVSKSKVFFILV